MSTLLLVWKICLFFLAKMVTLTFDQIIFGAKPFSQLAILPTYTQNCFLCRVRSLVQLRMGAKLVKWGCIKWLHDIKHKDIQQNDTQHDDNRHNSIQHIDTKHNGTELSFWVKFMMSVAKSALSWVLLCWGSWHHMK